MAIATRIIARNVELSSRDISKIHEKAAKLNRQMTRFPASSVAMQITVERHKRRKTEITVSLSLSLPSDVLYCQSTAAQISAAMDGAVRIMSRELTQFRSRLRGASAWKRQARRAHRQALKRPPPEPPFFDEKGDQLASMVSGLLRDNYQRLLNYINNKLSEMEGAGQAPAGAIDPMGILMELAHTCLRDPRRKPEQMSYLVWLYALAGRELTQAVSKARAREQEEVSLDEAAASDDGIERIEGYDSDLPMDAIETALEPSGTSFGEITPDPQAMSPDAQLMRGDLFAAVRALAAAWPELERESFELHYIEGLEAYEIAVLKSRSVTSVEQALEAVKHRLREAFFTAAEQQQVPTGKLDVAQIMSVIEEAAGRKTKF